MSSVSHVQGQDDAGDSSAPSSLVAFLLTILRVRTVEVTTNLGKAIGTTALRTSNIVLRGKLRVGDPNRTFFQVRAAPLVRVKAKFTVKNAVWDSLRRQHTVFLTVNLGFTHTRGAALKKGLRPIDSGHQGHSTWRRKDIRRERGREERK